MHIDVFEALASVVLECRGVREGPELADDRRQVVVDEEVGVALVLHVDQLEPLGSDVDHLHGQLGYHFVQVEDCIRYRLYEVMVPVLHGDRQVLELRFGLLDGMKLVFVVPLVLDEKEIESQRLGLERPETSTFDPIQSALSVFRNEIHFYWSKKSI